MLKKYVRFLTLLLLGMRSTEANASIPVSVDNNDGLKNCVNIGVILIIFYLGFGISNLQDLNLNIADAIEWQANRLIYIIVMYSSLELVLILSAFRTFQAVRLLYKAGPILTASEFDQIYLKTSDSLVIAFLWAGFFLGHEVLSFFRLI